MLIIPVLTILVVIVGALVVFLKGDSFRATSTDPLWDEVISGSGLTIIGTVLYSNGNEFILDVVRQDAPTLRAPSLYRVGDDTRIWQKNKWQKLNKAPEVGTVLLMHVPFTQEPTGIFIDHNYEFVKGSIEFFDKSKVVIAKEAYNLDAAYVENRAKGRETGAFAVLYVTDGEVESIEIWPREIANIANLITESRKIWEEDGFIPTDIQITCHDGFEITGFEYPFKSCLNEARNLIYTLEGEFVASEMFLPFDEFEMQIEFRKTIYSSTWESKSLDELGLDESDLKIAGKDYYKETYFFAEDRPGYLFAKSWQEGFYTVWKEVVRDDVDSSSEQSN